MMSRKWDIACMGKEARKNKVSATLSGAYVHDEHLADQRVV